MEPSGDKEALTSIQHPLENSVVLDHVFGYLQTWATFEDWKIIRAVSRTWYFQTLAKWRSIAILNLKLGPSLYPDQPASPGILMSEFLELAQNEAKDFCQLTDKPFQNYKLQNLQLDLSSMKENTLFWSSVGPNIKSLTLHKVNFKIFTNPDEKEKEIMELLVNQIPNLESFAVSKVFLEGIEANQPPQQFTLVHLKVKAFSTSNCFAFGFANFPNLRRVTLKSCRPLNIANLIESNPAVIQEQAIRTNNSIERLNIEYVDVVGDRFLSMKFAVLKHISIGNNAKFDFNLLWMSAFIMKHTATLETIEVFGSLREATFRSILLFRGNLSNLTELRAWGSNFSDLNFLDITPNLKVLHLDLYGFEKPELMKEKLGADESNFNERKIQIQANVDWCKYRWETGIQISARRLENFLCRNLHYFQINYEISKNSLIFLAKWMPNLKTLKTVLSKVTFPVVCENWHELEHLECMFGSSIVNENITGTGVSSSRIGRKKALVDMENLTSFKFHTECNKSLLSDDSVVSGFLRVPKLTDLSICVSPDFSEEAEIRLRRGIQNVQLYRNYSSNLLHRDWQCCRDKEYSDFILSLTAKE